MKNLVALLMTITLTFGIFTAQNSFAQRLQAPQNQKSVKDNKQKKWIDILSFNKAVNQNTKAFLKTESGKRVPIFAMKIPGMRKFGNVTLKRGIVKSMPKLQESLAKGKIMPRMQLVVYTTEGKGKEQHYYTINLVNATIANIRTESMSRSASDPLPEENFSLNFEEIKVMEISKDKFGRKQKKMVYTN